MNKSALDSVLKRYMADLPGREINCRGRRMHVLDCGAGEPVLMLHGNPSWSIYYRNLARALGMAADGGKRFRVIVPDHIGCGLSEKPDDARYAYTLENRVRDLQALLEELQLREPLNLVVHDWGGMIGFAWALDHLPQVRRIVALNTAAFPLPRFKSLPFALWLGRDTLLGPPLIRGLNLFAKQAARIGCKRNPMPPELRRAYCAPYDSWANRIAILRFVQDIPLESGDRAWPLVKRVADNLGRFANVPLLICWGMQDFVFDERMLAEWRRRAPHAEIHEFADCGHYILEDAADEVIPLIRDFLLR